ncbi:SATase_N domain-containing protein, partial [Haematococcus lacustris]
EVKLKSETFHGITGRGVILYCGIGAFSLATPIATTQLAAHIPSLVHSSISPSAAGCGWVQWWRHNRLLQAEGAAPRRCVAPGWAPLRTMAPDKSHLMSKMDQLILLSSASGSPDDDSLVLSRMSSPEPGMYNGSLQHLQRLPPLEQPHDNEVYNPSAGWVARKHHLTKQQLWDRIVAEARVDAASEPALATFLHSVLLSHSSLEVAMSFLLANKLADDKLLGSVQVMSLFQEAYAADHSLIKAAMADLNAVLDRDPACSKFSQCLLYFKGFQAIQCYRVTHWLWRTGRKPLAHAIQSKISEIFAVDIHPAAELGRGVMLDHATGIVIGETAVVGDNVSMLHHVSLGGSGTGTGTRHPHVGHGVLLGAGVTVLGPVTVGAGSKVGAGSVVVTSLPAHCVAVGVPANIVKRNINKEPVREMDQCTDFIPDYVI